MRIIKMISLIMGVTKSCGLISQGKPDLKGKAIRRPTSGTVYISRDPCVVELTFALPDSIHRDGEPEPIAVQLNFLYLIPGKESQDDLRNIRRSFAAVLDFDFHDDPPD